MGSGPDTVLKRKAQKVIARSLRGKGSQRQQELVVDLVELMMTVVRPKLFGHFGPVHDRVAEFT